MNILRSRIALNFARRVETSHVFEFCEMTHATGPLNATKPSEQQQFDLLRVFCATAKNIVRGTNIAQHQKDSSTPRNVLEWGSLHFHNWHKSHTNSANTLIGWKTFMQTEWRHIHTHSHVAQLLRWNKIRTWVIYLCYCAHTKKPAKSHAKPINNMYKKHNCFASTFSSFFYHSFIHHHHHRFGSLSFVNALLH